MNKILLTIIAAFILSLSVSAQSGAGRLKGFVNNSIKNDSITIDATVELRAIENWARNNSVDSVQTKDGYYDIEVSFGYYLLTISAKGYETYQTKVYIPSSSTLNWGTILEKSETKSDNCISGNCINGKGKIVYTDGNIYEGDFVNGKKEGQGTFTVKNGQVYVGQFANEKYSGKGKMTFPDGESYDGDWVDEKMTGTGIFTFNDGKVYVGQFSNDRRQGKGKLTYANGGVFEGNWVNDKIEGQGTFTHKNGDYYTGEWKNNKPDGFGKEYVKATNLMLEVTRRDGVLVNSTAVKQCVSGDCNTGFGKTVFPDGTIYEGNRVNAKLNGKGKMLLSNGDIYEGDFVNDQFEGQGTYTYKNGDYYIGEWKNGDRNGYGKFYKKATKTVRKGIWKDDVFVGK